MAVEKLEILILATVLSKAITVPWLIGEVVSGPAFPATFAIDVVPPYKLELIFIKSEGLDDNFPLGHGETGFSEQSIGLKQSCCLQRPYIFFAIKHSSQSASGSNTLALF